MAGGLRAGAGGVGEVLVPESHPGDPEAVTVAIGSLRAQPDRRRGRLIG